MADYSALETPNYFNYGFKKSFIDNPTRQQEKLSRLPPSVERIP